MSDHSDVINPKVGIEQAEGMNTTIVPNEFKVEFLDCCSQGPDVFCCACLCPCFIYGSTESVRKKDDNTTIYTMFHLIATHFGFGPCLTGMQRRDIRESHHIDGDLFTDILLSYCCHACVLIQSDSELRAQI